MAEAFRSGLGLVGPSQLGSAQSLGPFKWLAMSQIVFPQALAISVPGLCANAVFPIKEAPVVSALPWRI